MRVQAPALRVLAAASLLLGSASGQSSSDPTFSVYIDNDQAGGTALAYDETHDLYLMVWSQWSESGFTTEVRARRLTPSGQPIGGEILVDPEATIMGAELYVANVNATDSFLVTYDDRARRVRAVDGAVSEPVFLGFDAGSVGGDRTLGGEEAVVLGEYAPYAQRVHVPAEGPPTLVGQAATFLITNTDMRITESCNAAGQWMVVAQESYDSLTCWLIGRDLLPDTNPITLATQPIYDWSVAGDGSLAMLALTIGNDGQEEPLAYPVQQVPGGALELGAAISVGEEFGSDMTLDLIDVAATGHSFLIYYGHRYAFTGQRSRRIAQVELDACETCAEVLWEGPLGNDNSSAMAICADPAGSGRSLVAWNSWSDSALHVGRLGTTTGGATNPEVLAGCGDGGNLRVTGHLALDGEITLSLEGVDPQAFVGALSFSANDLFVESGSCTLMIPSFTMWTAPLGGGDSITLKLPGSAHFAGLELAAQWVTFGGSASPWITPNSSMSNAIAFQIAE